MRPTSYFLGEFDALGVREGLGLLVDVLDVQHLTHEFYDRLGPVERRGRHWGERREASSTHQSVKR